MKVYLLEAFQAYEGSYIVSVHATRESAKKAQVRIEKTHERYDKLERKADADPNSEFDYKWPEHYRYDFEIKEFKVKP